MIGPPPTLQDTITIHGSWWLPSNADDRLSGKLSFEPAGLADLEIVRAFRGLPSSELMRSGRDSSPVLLIVGQSDDGRFWSAANCVPVSFGTEDSQPVNYAPEYLLAGYAPGPNEQISFGELRIGCTNLAEWVRPFPEQDITVPIVRITYSFRETELLSAAIAEPEGRLSIQSRFDPGYGPAEIRIKGAADWVFEPTAPINVRTAMGVVRNCQNFLTLVLGVPVDITRIAGRCRPSIWAELITSLTRSNGRR